MRILLRSSSVMTLIVNNNCDCQHQVNNNSHCESKTAKARLDSRLGLEVINYFHSFIAVACEISQFDAN
jgi:hypothetical protein